MILFSNFARSAFCVSSTSFKATSHSACYTTQANQAKSLAKVFPPVLYYSAKNSD